MDEMSWQSRLLKTNINITNIDTTNKWIYFDFAYRPYPNASQRWGKTVVGYQSLEDEDALVEGLKDAVLRLRKELEG